MAVLNDRRKITRGHNRRRSPRWLVNRNVQIYVNQPDAPADGRKKPLILMGYTYDMSALGISVYLPALDCDIQDLFGEDSPLDVVLSTTPRQVKVKATPVRCETIIPAMPGKSACIGMLIDEQDNSYPNYIAYLREFQ